MEKSKRKLIKNPREGANPLSIISFKWILPLFLKGYKRNLDTSDIFEALNQHKSQVLGERITRYWEYEKKKNSTQQKKATPRLLRVLVKLFWKDMMYLGAVLGMLEFSVRLSQPFALSNVLAHFNEQDDSASQQAFGWCIVLAATCILEALIAHTCLQGLYHLGMKIRVACSYLLYSKIFKLSKCMDEQNSVGRIINLLTNDAAIFEMSLFTIHYVWIAIVQGSVILYFMCRQIGIAALGGVVIIGLFVPLIGILGKRIAHLTKLCSFRADERLRLTNEIISGIKVIKMYAWEKVFVESIEEARVKELRTVKKESITTEMTYSFDSYIPRFCLFTTIITYTYMGYTLDASTVYLITLCFNLIRSSVFTMFPIGAKELAKAVVATRRLETFLLTDEFHQYFDFEKERLQTKPLDNYAVAFNNFSAKWSIESEKQALLNLNVNISRGSLVALVGQVGSGKSSLMLSLLNELPWKSGQLTVNGKLSYCSQEPWIFNSSIRQNVLFGQPLDEERYKRVVEVCQLMKDFQQLPNGDQTAAGERGTRLSGGQCARINLARAVYYEADVYLLDDPLSAVDAIVSEAIFENCLKDFLKNKTVILCTHQIQYLNQVDKVIVMKDGSVQAEGSFEVLSKMNLEFLNSVTFHDKSVEDQNDKDVKEEKIQSSELIDNEEFNDEEETVIRGNVKLDTYKLYFKSAQSCLIIFAVCTCSVLFEVCCGSTDYFIAYWTAEEERFTKSLTNDTLSLDKHSNKVIPNREIYAYIYSGIITATVIVTCLQAFSFFEMTFRISKFLHRSMLRGVANTSMSFFNSNSLGRIMNRFSKDVNVIDVVFPRTVNDVKLCFMAMLTVVIIVTSTNFWFFLLIGFVALETYFFRKFYIKTSTAIKRLESINKSPMIKHVTDTINGLMTIRSFKAQPILMDEFNSHSDLYSSTCFMYRSGARAFGIYVELTFAILATCIIMLLYYGRSYVEASFAGLVISQCLMITSWMSYALRRTTDLENEITSVERTDEYTRLPREPGFENKLEVPKSWPEFGKVEFRNVSLIYDRQASYALKNLNFVIEPKEKIGIVGRTGAGKSSLINVLFALSNFSGEVMLDDVPILDVNLKILRPRITIIPQQPVLFAGTLRKNLDPFDEYTDDTLWQVLEEVELKNQLKSDLGLDVRVMDGGTNFSVGQRQLLCLARAIIRNNKLIVLDEATANVDPHTDKLIQETIRKKFVDSTVLIIAHRLITIMDCTKVLVMEAGQVVEFDQPFRLLEKKSGFFYDMVQKTGESMSKSLYEIAKEANKSNQNFSSITSSKL